MYEKIPNELKSLKQWCCFRIENRGNKKTKIPVNAFTGGLGRSNDETTWADYETAYNAIAKYKCDGLGFYFKAPYVGIDIDGVAEDIKNFFVDEINNNIVFDFVETLQSYTEISVSGNGIHIIVKGKLPPEGRRKGNVEMYDSGRFFAMTGEALKYDYIAQNEEALEILHTKYIKKEKYVVKQTASKIGCPISMDNVVDRAMSGRNGNRFSCFMHGGWESFYNSQSEADMAFCNDLAFWTNRDVDMMDQIFRSSALIRNKWDEKRGDATYGQMTINKAISDCMEVYDPKPNDGKGVIILDQQNAIKKVKKKRFGYDDTGNAERLANDFGEDIRYSYIRKSWLCYDGKKWVFDRGALIKNYVDQTITNMKKEEIYVPPETEEEEAKKNFLKHCKRTRNSNAKENMIKECKHLLPIELDQLDTHKDLLNVQNGYIDLKQGKLFEHDKKKYFSKVASVEYTDKIDCLQWLDFLKQIFENKQELINYVQRAVGYTLSASTEEQVMFFLFGDGNNGKSVFLDVVSDIMGDYAENINPDSLMVKQFNNASTANPDIAKLDGARMVTTSETDKGARLSESLVKQLTGGDVVTARFLNENQFSYKPKFKIWMATNHMPIIRGTDDGIWRRIVIIPFNLKIADEEIDKELPQKLKKELVGILKWAVEGYEEWKKQGLNPPPVVKQGKKEYRIEMDIIHKFLDECCTERAGERVQASELYQSYKHWAIKNNEYVMTNTMFGREIQKKIERKRINGLSWYYGIVLRRPVPLHVVN